MKITKSLFVLAFMICSVCAAQDTVKAVALMDSTLNRISSDSIIDLDKILDDTVVVNTLSINVDSIGGDSIITDSVVVDTLKTDTLKTDTLNVVRVPSDSLVVVKKDTVQKKVLPKKNIVIIPQSVLDLRKIYSDYRKYSDWAQDRWDDIYLSLSEIDMNPDYYKYVVPLTYYSLPFEEASGIKDWYPKDIIIEDSVRKVSMLEKGMPVMHTSNELDKKINRQLLSFYVSYPELVLKNETSLNDLGFLSYEDMTSAESKDDIISLIQNNAGFGQMSESELLVFKPNFWTYGGSGYLQFSQNYISDNWYKGGESTKSMLSGFTWQIKYDDKQKTQYEGKVEWKLGFITAPSDTVHSYKANNDLLRLSSKLGYRAIQNWYYTLSAEFQTQFFSNYATNSDDLVSALFSPATLNVGIGMDYKYVKDGKVNLSVLLNPLNYTLYSVMSDKVDPTKFNIKEGKKRENEFGSRINATLTWKILTSLLWDSKFSYTTNYEKVFSEWENTFTFVLNKYLSTKLFVHARYDDSVSKDPDESYFQLQELFSFGLNYTW